MGGFETFGLFTIWVIYSWRRREGRNIGFMVIGLITLKCVLLSPSDPIGWFLVQLSFFVTGKYCHFSIHTKRIFGVGEVRPNSNHI